MKIMITDNDGTLVDSLDQFDDDYNWDLNDPSEIDYLGERVADMIKSAVKRGDLK